MHRHATRSRVISLFVLALAASILAIPVTSGAAPSSQQGVRANLAKKVGTSSLDGVKGPVGTAVGSPSDELATAVRRSERPHSEKITSYNAPSSALVPTATDRSVAGAKVRWWRGLTEFDNRYSGGGQYSSEPADLGMCTNGSYVMELVNSAVQIYTSTGTARLTGTYEATVSGYTGPKAIDLNTFFDQPLAIDRTGPSPVSSGPSLFDIACLYDDATSRWFATTAMLELDPETEDYTGENSILIAVSSGSNPVTSTWSIYQLDATNDGVDAAGDPDGSPDHDCADNGVDASQCFGDYPQIGIDENGFYVTTNEFDWWGSDFNGAQVYAFNKYDLITGEEEPRMVFFSGDYDGVEGAKGVTSAAFEDEEAYTLQPVNALAAERAPDTMFFGSSLSWYYGTGTDQLSLYAIDNTDELLEDSPDTSVMTLTETLVSTGATKYGLPPKAQQKAGSAPTLELYNAGYFGNGFGKITSPIPLDSGSGKFYGAWLDNGYVFLTTASEAAGTGGAEIGNRGSWKPVSRRSAIALFVVDVAPSVSTSVTTSRIVGVAGQNLVYPSVAVNRSGKGAIGATLAGPSFYPSAVMLAFDVNAYGGVTLGSSFGQVRPGAGPNDGYTGWYAYYWRSRWGDYGATGIEPSGAIWMAAGAITQTCTRAQYLADDTCGYTRDTYANWSTMIYRYAP